MKLSLLLLILAVCGLSTSSYGEVDNAFGLQKESGLESDHETMQIKDLEAERKMAKEQAALQQQMTKEAKDRFDEVKTHKQEISVKADADISASLNQRKEAEKANKKYKDESERLAADLKKLEESTEKARRAAKDATDIAIAGREELNMMRMQKVKLENENKQALLAQNQTEGEMNRLREEYGRLTASVKELEQKVAVNQAENKRKQALIIQGIQQVSALKLKESQLKTTLGIKQTVVQPAKVSKAPSSTCDLDKDLQCK